MKKTHLDPTSAPVSALRVVLVETETPGNLGAAARAMKSMGLVEMRLVNVRGWDSAEARDRAMSARDVLKSAEHFPDLESAISDCGLVLGATGKSSSLDLPRYTPREAAQRLWDAERVISERSSQVSSQVSDTSTHLDPPAIVFGRESRGLTREELTRCHAHVTIPTHPSCPSLNLASAVQVIAYEHWVTRTLYLDSPVSAPISAPVSAPISGASLERTSKHELASTAQREHLITLFERLAIGVGALNPDQPRQLMRRFRELLNRALPRRAELSIMQSVLGRALKRLSEEPHERPHEESSSE